MTQYMISFPSAAMQVSDDEFAAVAEAAHAVVDEAKAAGVLVYAGGLSEEVAPVRVSAERTVTNDTYPQTIDVDGGITIVDVPTREAAIEWAAKVAAACRCAQELREFAEDTIH
ncbi:YciI family protein [Leifsonia sp. NPDC058292]|uniref:YciI family protein n=1 Tax=Leifsonia sp. NPDC058292 TaxID=3346428 RepID=UPI0036DD6D3F